MLFALPMIPRAIGHVMGTYSSEDLRAVETLCRRIANNEPVTTIALPEDGRRLAIYGKASVVLGDENTVLAVRIADQDCEHPHHELRHHAPDARTHGPPT